MAVLIPDETFKTYSSELKNVAGCYPVTETPSTAYGALTDS